MNAHTTIEADPVAAFMPWVQPEERDLRRRVLVFQQRASMRACRSESDRARGLWWLIVEIAAETAFTPATTAHLEEVLQLLTWQAHCANGIERWEAPDPEPAGSTGE